VQGDGGVKNMFLTGLGELIGTFIVVFVGCMGCIGSLGVLPKHLQITLNFGLAVMVAIQVSQLVEYLKTIAARCLPIIVLFLRLKFGKKILQFRARQDQPTLTSLQSLQA